MKSHRLSIVPYQLTFRQPAGTSRGIYTIRKVWYIVVSSLEDKNKWGIGECAPLPDLSIDALPDYEYYLAKACRAFEKEGIINTDALRPFPSILFGLETAVRHYETGSFALWDTSFSRGEEGIPINGLIWMGDYRSMLEQIETKITAGYRCVKLKIGAIRFEEEIKLLRHIRKHFTVKDIELRVDANGAFSPQEAPDKLNRLAEWDIHSIEQPIRAGQWEEMARLTAVSPIPIALDEELIGLFTKPEKQKLLETIRPQYIILKPSLHGGIHGCNEWIEEAEQLQAGWWITSALESNIGLNAIAQWCATRNNPLPQGLGTGQLFTENIEMHLYIRKDCLWFDNNSCLLNHKPLISNDGMHKLCCFNKAEKLLDNKKENPFDKSIHDFLSQWFNESSFIEVKTSGSTGTPKTLTVRKEQMIQSARITIEYLGLQKDDTALLCMPVEYIAGKMMIIRSLVAGLRLIVRTPSSHPLANVEEPICFAAMTPMQVYNSLQIPLEAERLKQIGILLVGGGPISKELEKELSSFPNSIYATYGMTETLSHIALRPLTGKDISSFYHPFPSVRLSLSMDHTLIIDAPLVCDEILITNDIAELLPDGCFRILGRKDNVINSGGIKIQIEEVEEILRSIISFNFAITSVPHPQYGEAVVLLSEQKTNGMEEEINRLLPAYQHPRYMIKTDKIPQTGSGKTDRTACKELAVSMLKTII